MTETTYAERLFGFISTHLDAGRTVYASNYLRVIPMTPKNRALIRLSADRNHVEVSFGKRWDSINGCKITAR